MIVERASGTISHQHVRDLPHFLRPEDCLVLNNTKVLPARLIGQRTQTGGHWEGLFLTADEHGIWKILSKTRGKLTPGEQVALQTPEGRVGISLELLARQDDGTWLAKPQESDPWSAVRGQKSEIRTTGTLLDRVGWVPLPPYIRNGRMIPADREQYQTVYATKPGAVAAPTAGLHFSPELLTQIQNLGLDLVPVTLHVGAGTFKPITAETMDAHVMHYEWCEITEKAVARIQRRQQQGGRVIAIGTTSVRVLESVSDNQGVLRPFSGETNLFIKPGYTFKTVDAMMTNFHLPLSTLLILVRTFGGDALLRRAYDEAIAEEYRFFSYGDAMLIL
jgi:S-adenosylmethionine:tRNA ribosyltransferase-isomerase